MSRRHPLVMAMPNNSETLIGLVQPGLPLPQPKPRTNLELRLRNPVQPVDDAAEHVIGRGLNRKGHKQPAATEPVSHHLRRAGPDRQIKALVKISFTDDVTATATHGRGRSSAATGVLTRPGLASRP
jgi:hypothetical protein